MSQNPQQPAAQPQSKLSGQAPVDRVQWPSLRSYFGAFRRHFLLAILFCIPIAFLVLLGLSLWPREYSSTALVLFDPNQTRTEAQESSLVLANRMASTFTARFQDPDFMSRLAKVLGAQGFPLPEPSESALKGPLSSLLPANLQPPSWNLSEEEMLEKAHAEQLTEQLKAESVAALFQLSVVAKAETPAEAQQLARESMNLFIVEELSKQKSKIQNQIRQLASLEASTLREKNAPADMGRTEPIQEPRGGATASVKRELKNREQRLISDILGRQAELVRAQGNQVNRQFELDSELNNLLSRKGPFHPDVIQKRRELDKFKNDPVVAKIEAELGTYRRQLNEVQLQMRRQLIPIDRSVQISAFSDEVRRYLMDVSNQIRNLELEVNSLDDQIRDPAKRTRFTLLREPELPSQPSNRKKFLAAAGVGALLVIASFFMVIVVREFFSPMVQDREAFKQRYELPVVAEVKSSWQKKHRCLTSGEIRALRSRLHELGDRAVPELLLLDGYRYLQQYLTREEPSPQVICIIDVSQENKSSYLASNLANVMATDSAEKVFLLSFNALSVQAPDAAGAPSSEQAPLLANGSADLMAFMAGKAEWKDCRIKADESFAFDSAVARQAAADIQAFRADTVQKLIKALREKYQRVVIEGFGPNYLQENGLLCKEADAIVMQVGLGHTKKAALDRLLQLENPAKIKAVILQT